MYKLLRIALFAVPLAGGAAWAQGSGTSGSAGAPAANPTPPVTDDTRTPLQQKAGRIDDTTPALPGDATKPTQVPNTNEQSNTPAVPDKKSTLPDDKAMPPADESALPHKSDVDHDSTKIDNKADSDAAKDQSNTDK
jgi:hypothetical protein